MRPILLKMQAFGPYAKIEEIDFRKLENRKMFVVSGPTGSGKTMIFDGLCFALYGAASSDERSGADLRSDFADKDLETKVSLSFELRNKSYRIVRKPIQARPRVRGEGFRTVSATASLYEITDGEKEKLIASSVTDVDRKILEIMQIDSNQFRQIVMIPQGEFQKLLFSNSRDKEVILQRLFKTEHYKLIEEKLKLAANSLHREIEQQIRDRSQILSNTVAQSKLALHAELQKEVLNNDKLMGLLETELKLVEQVLESLKKELQAKRKNRDGLLEEKLTAVDLLEKFKELDRLANRKKELKEAAPLFEEKARKLKLAKQAASLQHEEEYCLNIKADLADQHEAIKKINQEKTSHQEKLEQLKINYDKELNREEDREVLRKKITKLESIREDVFAFAKEAASLEQAKKTQKEYQEERDSQQTKLNFIRETSKNLEKDRENLQESRLKLANNETSLLKLSERLELMKDYKLEFETCQELKKDLIEAEKAAQEIELSLDKKKEFLKSLIRQEEANQAYLLAEKLEESCPCPVCGSTNHPQKASQHQDHNNSIDGEQINKLQENLAGMEEELASRIEVTNKVAAKSSYHQDKLSNSFDKIKELEYDPDDYKIIINKLEKDYHDLKLENKELEQGIEELAELEIKIKKNIEKIAHYELNLESMQAEITRLTEGILVDEANLNRMKEAIPEELRSREQFERELFSRVENLGRLEKALNLAQETYVKADRHLQDLTIRHEENQKQVKNMKANLEKAEENFEKNIMAAGFRNFNHYEEARLSPEEINSLEEKIEAYHNNQILTKNNYQQLQDQLKNLELPNLGEIDQSISLIEKTIENLVANEQDINARQVNNRQILANAKKVTSQIAEKEADYAVIGDIANMATGRNSQNLTFERYVLAAFLDEIVLTANDRLYKMTNGRYQLLRKEDRSKGNVQSGLELLVYDEYTGSERHVKTLSGGESFKAALSLALGLADVVQSYSGGVSLETMFIDEGFGTLDVESLDQAIETLIEIQSSGRLVGVISHVAQLRERIDAQLLVTSTQTGSETKFIIK